MGIYFSNIRSILEVKRKINSQEEDLDQENDNNEEPQDNNDKNNENNNEDDEHADPGEASDYSMDVEDDEDNTEDNGEEDNEDDEHSDPGESNDYSMDVDDSEDGEDNQDDESSESDSEEDDASSDDSGEGGDNELKSLEDDIFKDVPPEQMNIKIMELKKQYLEVYATITDVLTRCNKIPKSTHNMKVVEFIVNKLVEFKELVNFYLSNTFDTKTYVENMVNYQQYLATLNTINKLLKEINTKKENNS